MSALGFGSFSHGEKNGRFDEGGKILLLIMHEGDADYGYLLSIVGVFIYLLFFWGTWHQRQKDMAVCVYTCFESVLLCFSLACL